MKNIIWERPDGEMLITVPAYNDPITGQRAGEVEEDYLDRVAARQISVLPMLAAATRVGNVEECRLPVDTQFRAAWRWNGASVVIDMSRAREIHMGRIRMNRDAALLALDIETTKAVGKGDDAERARVEAEKRRLRDIPQTFDLSGAKTPEELSALWPADLRRTSL